jgi:aromatic-L-amino-acid decarboxylase
VPLNVVCFRYAPPELSEDRRNGVNLEVLMRLQERGIAAPSGTTLGGRFALRTAITNHRSRREDFDLLVEESRRLGREVVGEGVA